MQKIIYSEKSKKKEIKIGFKKIKLKSNLESFFILFFIYAASNFFISNGAS